MSAVVTFLGFRDNWAQFNVDADLYAYYLDPCLHHSLSVLVKKSGLKALNFAKENAIEEVKK